MSKDTLFVLAFSAHSLVNFCRFPRGLMRPVILASFGQGSTPAIGPIGRLPYVHRQGCDMNDNEYHGRSDDSRIEAANS
jgi:hypothetical protein